MPLTKADIADVLNEIAVLLELKGENPFKVRAYQNGARILENLEEDLDQLVVEERLANIKGVGAALAQKISELHETGKLEFHEKLRASLPAGLFDVLEIPGLGAKKVRAMYDKLGVDSIETLTKACEDGRVAELSGFGAKTQQKILDGIKNREAYARRHLWWDAFAVAEPILQGLRDMAGVERAEHAGSLRRGLETVGDLDFIASSSTPAPVMDWFTSMDGVSEVTAKGETKSSVRMESGLQADLRVVSPEHFVYALHHFTGSKEHNVLMRQRALERGMSLGEWGLARSDDSSDVKLPGELGDEAELYSTLGLNFIPPELREGRGEIEAAEEGPLPKLIEYGDLRGVFHNHTDASDGHGTLEEMAAAAHALGWEYLGIADHSKASYQANGLNEERLARQIETIRNLNESGEAPVAIFAGVECDILVDGRLDLDESILRELDYVVASVHVSLGQSEEEMTKRLIRAIEHSCTTMLGHVSGRLLLAREPAKLDHAKVIDAAAANGVVIELNANPRRLDMDWRWWRRATEKGVLCAINPDAHSTWQLEFTKAGVRVARKGWLEAHQVLNTRSLGEMRLFFEKRRI